MKTSGKCPKCGYTHADNRKTQVVFLCQSCAFSGNADYVAALNILAAGWADNTCGEDTVVTSMKQEPVGDCEVTPPN